jgi:DnaD/phage-associated family protein
VTKGKEPARFEGFPPGKVRQIPIPSQFFIDLLPAIEDLNELKITLYSFWRLSRAEGKYRFIARSEFDQDELLQKALGSSPAEAAQAVEEGLGLCTTRGTLLSAAYQDGTKSETIYFLNTPRGRAALHAIEKGAWNPAEEPPEHFELNHEPVSIFRLYEDQIGPLNPMIAESLQEAEALFPQTWIEEAFKIAAENNVRRWRYIETILQNWAQEGKDERRNPGESEESRQRYVRGPYSDLIEH